MNEHELGLINSFIKQEKRDRYKNLLLSKKSRKKFFNLLYHIKDFDESKQIIIPPGEHKYISIHQMLGKYGAKEICYVLSDNSLLNEQELVLKDVLEKIVGSGNVAVVSCIPGTLAYSEGEEPNNRY